MELLFARVHLVSWMRSVRGRSEESPVADTRRHHGEGTSLPQIGARELSRHRVLRQNNPCQTMICKNKDLGYSFFPSLALPNNAVMLWRNFANDVCNSK